MQRNEVNFKALTFVSEQTASTFNYEVKGVRAIWDPSLSIPGTNRRGGWRCPVGTRYGGQITDRFGRSCGWGVARRIANQIADIGERLENIDDRKRNNRLAKRNARMQRLLARQEKPGLLERGARGIAEALEGEQTPRQVRPSLRPTSRQPLGGMIDPNTGRVIPLKPNPEIERAQEIIQQVGSRRNPRRRRGNLRESEQRRIDREIEQPGAPRTGEVAPKRPARRQPLGGMIDPNTGRVIPLEQNPAIEQAREILEQAGKPRAPRNQPRRRRRVATQQGAKRTARRKPEADFVDGAKPAPTVVPQRKPPSAPPKPIVVEPDPNFNAPKPAKPSSPIPNPPPWNPTADEMARLGGSLPDARSERNVRNRFRERGLPDTAYWREDAYQGDDKAELERRFGRYYDDNNQRNERGNYVNRRLAAGGGKPVNRSKPPARPKTPAKPEAPNAPAAPPPMRRVLDVDGEFSKPEDQAFKDIINRDLNNYEPNAYNNLRGLSKEQLEGNKARLKQEQEALDTNFDLALNRWNREKNYGDAERAEARAVLAQAHIQRERNKLAQEAVDMRMIEIDAGIEWRQKVPKPLANVPQPQVRAPQAPIADIPEPEGGFDVSPPISKDDHKPDLLGKMGEDGLPDVKGVPMGNKGIDNPQKAIDHLEKGGNLADVPDDLLKDALNGASGRFTATQMAEANEGGGVNAGIPGNMTLYVDNLTGKKYFLKYQVKSQARGEDLHEVIGNNLAGRFGFPVGGFRADGKQSQGFDGNPADAANNGRAILFEHASNYVDGRIRAGRDGAERDIKASDRVRATLLDFVMVNRDRHGGNYFVATDANGRQRFVPIDPSLGFDANWGDEVHLGYGADDAGFVGWLGNRVGGGRNDMLRSLREQYLAGSLSRREVTAIVSDVQKAIRDAEQKNPYMNMVEDALFTVGADGKRRLAVNRDKIAVRPQQKMKYITDVDPSRIANLILGI